MIAIAFDTPVCRSGTRPPIRRRPRLRTPVDAVLSSRGIDEVPFLPTPRAAVDPSSRPVPPDPADSLLVTNELLVRARDGDEAALAELMARYLPRLRRWARGRLPGFARGLMDTSDLVQETLTRVITGLDRIEVRGPHAFQSYVRQAVLNRIRDEVRHASRRPGPDGVPETLPDLAPSPLENAIGADVLARYEKGLGALSEEERQLLHLRLELALDYPEITALTGRASKDATRMAIRRALARLAEEMDLDR